MMPTTSIIIRKVLCLLFIIDKIEIIRATVIEPKIRYEQFGLNLNISVF